jgi:hypothetical protein
MAFAIQYPGYKENLPFARGEDGSKEGINIENEEYGGKGTALHIRYLRRADCGLVESKTLIVSMRPRAVGQKFGKLRTPAKKRPDETHM